MSSTIEKTKSAAYYEEAKKYFPGGVNSPVRAFRSVGGNPIFFERGKGPRVWDVDGNEYIDFCCSWGPLIHGHADPQVIEALEETIQRGTSFGVPTVEENQLAALILNNHKYIEKIRFVNSGTEAVMSAIRLARGATGRNKVIKFEGCYHGHVDALMVKAGSGLATFGTSSSAGIPEDVVKDTLVLPLNDLELLEETVRKYKDDLACVIIEPIPANNGLLIQNREYLLEMRRITAEHGVLLIFDEVISGFRVGFEGAAGHYNIQPDIFCFGKIIGGGLPVGAYAASNDIMSNIAPEGDVYQAGTLSGNPVAMAAGRAQLEKCLGDGFYEDLERKTGDFVSRLDGYLESKGYPVHVYSMGSIFWMTFGSREIVRRADHISQEELKYFSRFYHLLLEKGIYIGPSAFEVGFVSSAHSKDDLEQAMQSMCEAFDEIFNADSVK